MLLIHSDQFFNKLKEIGLRRSNNIHENLSDFLKIDAQYPHLILFKKLVRAVELASSNNYCMQIGVKVKIRQCFNFTIRKFRFRMRT